MAEARIIVVGVTSDVSLTLMRGFPQFLRSKGWVVHVVSAPGPFLEALSLEPDLITHKLPMKRQPSLVSDLRSLAAWVRLLARIRPDVVSVGTPKAGLLGCLAARLARVPYRVYHLRGLRLETTTGLRLKVLTALERLTMNSAHDVIAVSASLRRRAIDLGLVKADRIHVLGHGSSNGVVIPSRVPTDKERAAKRHELGLDPAVPVIGFVGRLNVDKGLAVLAMSREILVDRSIDHQMLVVGGIDENASPSIADSLRSTGRQAVETGQVPDARGYYAAMDFLCLPTLREGFPNVVLEAAAAGIPSVTTNATGAIDSVVEGITGFVAAVRDATSLADRLQEMIEAGTIVRTALGAAARSRVQQEFSRERVWSLLDEFIAAGTRERPSR